MIIVSQDRTKIINFNNVGNVNIEKCYNESLKKEDFSYDILVYIISSGLVRLGKYKTKERAKEVLQEIVSKYKTTLYNTKTNETVVNIPKVYEMPTK